MTKKDDTWKYILGAGVGAVALLLLLKSRQPAVQTQRVVRYDEYGVPRYYDVPVTELTPEEAAAAPPEAPPTGEPCGWHSVGYTGMVECRGDCPPGQTCYHPEGTDVCECMTEEEMPVGIPEDNGGGFSEPFDFISNETCRSECHARGFMDGACIWDSEVPGNDAASNQTKIGVCYIEGSRHCGQVGQCNCWCWHPPSPPGY